MLNRFITPKVYTSGQIISLFIKSKKKKKYEKKKWK